MEVRILNPEVLKDLYKNHGVFACTCYNTPEKYAERVGISCQKSGHMSGSRCEYIKFRITDIDRGTAEQCMRHEIGVSIPFLDTDNWAFTDMLNAVSDVRSDQIIKNMGSFRYINKEGFSYTIPKEIERNETAKNTYKTMMAFVEQTRKSIKELLEQDGVSDKRANEVANFVLPRATNSTLTIGFTPEALIHFMHKRLCRRSQPEIRTLAKLIKKAIIEISPEFAKELVPHCKYLMWCPEGKMSCGVYPTREELKETIKKNAEVVPS